MRSPGPPPACVVRTPGRKSGADRWDFSHSSASSGGSSSSGSTPGSGRNPVALVARAIGSCFAGNGGAVVDNARFPSVSSASSAETEKKHRNLSDSLRTSTPSHSGHKSFTIGEILKATKNFSSSNKIGEGAFGTVYKGILANGLFVAVKRSNKKANDKGFDNQFHNEILTLSQIEHLNLVRFMGYVEEKDEKIIVLEFVPNGTLRQHLEGVYGNSLDFARRLDIAIDVVHAVTYLHMYSDNPIIHRDIKSSNILLTDNLRAKVADFGLARLGATEVGVSHVVTEVKGTTGYLDPEYFCTNQLTVKSDVYSFGVVLVELMSGRAPIEPQRGTSEGNTLRWARRNFEAGKAIAVLDANIEPTPATVSALENTLELAFQCMSPSKQGRPSMRRCGKVLWSIRKQYSDNLSLGSPLMPPLSPIT